METFLVLNGLELEADVDDSETAILTLAAGKMDRTVFNKWVTDRVRLLD